MKMLRNVAFILSLMVCSLPVFADMQGTWERFPSMPPGMLPPMVIGTAADGRVHFIDEHGRHCVVVSDTVVEHVSTIQSTLSVSKAGLYSNGDSVFVLTYDGALYRGSFDGEFRKDISEVIDISVAPDGTMLCALRGVGVVDVRSRTILALNPNIRSVAAASETAFFVLDSSFIASRYLLDLNAQWNLSGTVHFPFPYLHQHSICALSRDSLFIIAVGIIPNSDEKGFLWQASKATIDTLSLGDTTVPFYQASCGTSEGFVWTDGGNDIRYRKVGEQLWRNTVRPFSALWKGRSTVSLLGEKLLMGTLSGAIIDASTGTWISKSYSTAPRFEQSVVLHSSGPLFWMFGRNRSIDTAEVTDRIFLARFDHNTSTWARPVECHLGYVANPNSSSRRGLALADDTTVLWFDVTSIYRFNAATGNLLDSGRSPFGAIHRLHPRPDGTLLLVNGMSTLYVLNSRYEAIQTDSLPSWRVVTDCHIDSQGNVLLINAGPAWSLFNAANRTWMGGELETGASYGTLRLSSDTGVVGLRRYEPTAAVETYGLEYRTLTNDVVNTISRQVQVPRTGLIANSRFDHPQIAALPGRLTPALLVAWPEQKRMAYFSVPAFAGRSTSTSGANAVWDDSTHYIAYGGPGLWRLRIHDSSTTSVLVDEVPYVNIRNVVPNPTSSRFRILLNFIRSVEPGDCKIRITTLNGRTLRNYYPDIRLNGGEHFVDVDVQDIPQGLYLLSATLANYTHTKIVGIGR